MTFNMDEVPELSSSLSQLQQDTVTNWCPHDILQPLTVESKQDPQTRTFWSEGEYAQETLSERHDNSIHVGSTEKSKEVYRTNLESEEQREAKANNIIKVIDYSTIARLLYR